MKKIIVPIDFSECAENALQNAALLAERLNMELIIHHTYILPVAIAESTPGLVGEEMDTLREGAEKRVDKLIKEIAKHTKVKVHSDIQAGVLMDNVEDLIKTHDIAFVIMGTQGAGGLQRAFLGSNTYHLMKHIKHPIIALPCDSDISKMTKIAIAGDYKSLPEASALQPIIELANAFYAEICIIHIDQDPALEHDEIEIAKGLEKYLKKVKHSFHFRRDFDVEEGLVAFAQEEKINLMAMIARHHNIIDRITHGSETKRMMLDIPMPLMIVHE